MKVRKQRYDECGTHDYKINVLEIKVYSNKFIILFTLCLKIKYQKLYTKPFVQ
jgi:hypothetical protein